MSSVDQLMDLVGKTNPEVAERYHLGKPIVELVALRMRLGLTQAEVAERMNVSQSRISQVEGFDAKVSFEGIAKYAAALVAELRVVKPKEKKEARITSAMGGRVGSPPMAAKGR